MNMRINRMGSKRNHQASGLAILIYNYLYLKFPKIPQVELGQNTTK